MFSLLLMMFAVPQQQAPGGSGLEARVARVRELADRGEDFRLLGAALQRLAALQSPEAEKALEAFLEELNGNARLVTLQALAMTHRPEAFEFLHEVVENSKQLPERQVAARALAMEEDFDWLRGFFKHCRSGFLRGQILEAMLAQRAPDLDELVLAAVGDKDAGLREVGLKAVAELGTPGTARLVSRALKDSNIPVRAAAAAAAGRIGGSANYKVLVKMLKERSEVLRRSAAAALRHADEPKEVAVLVAALRKAKKPEQILPLADALAVAARAQPKIATEALLGLLDSKDERIRRRVIEGLAAGRPDGVLDVLVQVLDNGSETTRNDAAWALAEIGGIPPAAEHKLVLLSRSSSPALRLNAIRALGGGSTPEGHQALLDALADDSWAVRSAAVDGLSHQRSRDTVLALAQALPAETGRVRDEMAAALENLTGLPYGRDGNAWSRWAADLPPSWTPPSREEARAALAKIRTQRAATNRTAGYHGLPLPSGGTVFVLDISGSMNELYPDGSGRTYAEHFRKALETALENLGSTTPFDLVLFESSNHVWRPELAVPDADTIRDASAFLEDTPPFGGTNLFDALRTALGIEGVQTIYVLTDGEPSVGFTSTEGILEAITEMNRDRRIVIHTIAAGTAAASFLADLAAANGGQAVDLRTL